MSKRKIRDEDVDEDNLHVGKASCVSYDTEKVACVETVEQNEFDRFLIPGLRFATESWAGLKTRNEDRHVYSTEFFPGPVFGIFDGHGGTFSADFLSRHLVATVASVIQQNIGEKALAELYSSHWLSRREEARKKAILDQLQVLHQQLAELESMESVSESADDVQVLVGQLNDAIAQIDDELKQIDAEQAARREERRHWCNEHHRCFLKSFKDAFEQVDEQILQKKPSQDGSTALLIWFFADTFNGSDGNDTGALVFYTANVGDCRAVMCRSGRGVALTRDHKPDRPDETQRIERAGGLVDKIAGIPRVYSAAGAGLTVHRVPSTYLAVSRAFGDRSLKKPTPLVSIEPEVKQFTVRDDDLFLILACDGIWDVLSDQEAVDIALPHFNDTKAAADAIVKAAYKKGSVDNLTATVVQFGWKQEGQVQRALEAAKLKTTDGSEEEIDMFNL
ncbi:putative protein phosphatase 2C 59 [Phytophthora citrophthora]|uniref:PPM-type phosphatase domain-containing protein n=1 Tax=Phytophthora citrophthora TaxID=4793 RepID=A0AAD9H228_9STRA|nr:putative protein phosphatase 2C 59 [Phytophthora citrophthora]